MTRKKGSLTILQTIMSFYSSSSSFSRLPKITNEPMKSFIKGSFEREELSKAMNEMISFGKTHQIPIVINGQKSFNQIKKLEHFCTSNLKNKLFEYDEASELQIEQAIVGALKAKSNWESMSFNHRAAIFLKAADLLSTKYRYKMLAATMLGQGKNIWQAEIDSIAELADFWRFNCQFAQDLYDQQPREHSTAVWNRVDYRPLEGFVTAISPFNFTAIGGNLPSAPALMGNVVLWKPSPSSLLSNYLIYQILEEAGLPSGVIQFIPCNPESFVKITMNHFDFAGLHFTGSTAVFQDLWKRMGENIHIYRSFPRLVGETGGKNMHFIHSSADLNSSVQQTIRAAYEYQGQKCSACSRLYVPDGLWNEFKDSLISNIKNIKSTSVENLDAFCGPVINRIAYERIVKYIEYAREHAEILAGGTYSDKDGLFIDPTLVVTNDPQFKTMQEEIFGPVLTVYVYPQEKWKETLSMASMTGKYGLTAGIFAKDRHVIEEASEIIKHSAGNLYINDKCTGAIVGQQPFGGSRHSGTNDKAGSILNLIRWTSVRTIKENFLPLDNFKYSSN